MKNLLACMVGTVACDVAGYSQPEGSMPVPGLNVSGFFQLAGSRASLMTYNDMYPLLGCGAPSLEQLSAEDPHEQGPAERTTDSRIDFRISEASKCLEFVS